VTAIPLRDKYARPKAGSTNKSSSNNSGTRRKRNPAVLKELRAETRPPQHRVRIVDPRTGKQRWGNRVNYVKSAPAPRTHMRKGQR
jgi:hypothetical protein